ncbi:gliding motility lipoprotein GldB [Christiangramia forsetii]|uniref:Gliding motility protein GldB n=2 Tax=Christiangramia forsetii TaxID=411153 RepID=A0M541_CHRFK|nr:gliding motility lipoprotein GldB [Christiangramia forsetii]GGG21913.1 gliding motility lipoprotein GldB [Christiangramia forsetii]CAL67736.1 gliding motility protein GldB [Christiangramia forsetii KT0803]
MLKRFWFLILFVSILSCDNTSETEARIEKIDANFEVIRFDQKFAEVTEDSLPELKAQYPFLFPKQFPDSVWIQKLNDSIQLEIEAEVTKTFPEFSEETDDLHALFQHVKYYFPDFQIPDVITITSEVDYKNKAIYTSDYLFLSLDTYLGEEHKFYIGIQDFLRKNFRKNQIIPDAANEIAKSYVPKADSRTFLAHMLYYGKILYLKDKFIPFKNDAEKIGYTRKEMDWAQSNEDQIWRYFIENELIYDTDSQLYTRFLYPAPFSKFYLQLDAESPARIGQYIGWNIVRAYMDKNDVSINKMLNTSAEEIFNKANYKPKK